MTIYVAAAPAPHVHDVRVYEKMPLRWDGYMYLECDYYHVEKRLMRLLGVRELPVCDSPAVIMMDLSVGRLRQMVTMGNTEA